MIKTSSIKQQHFTLLEVLVAVVILVGMMTMMLYIISTAQKSFKLQESRTEMFQRSRMIFDLVERDVRSIVTNELEGKEIGYYIFAHDPKDITKRTMVTMVSSGDPDDAARSRLTEISYSFHRSEDDLDDRFIIKRQLVTEAHADDWDFCGAPLDWAINDSSTSDDFQTVIGGVYEFDIAFVEVGGTNAVSGATYTKHPIRVLVTLELFDDSLSAPEFNNKREAFIRGFSKVFYIGHIHSR